MAEIPKFSDSVQKKLAFYKKAGTLSGAAFTGTEMRKLVKLIRQTSGSKIAGVTDVVRDQIRKTLSDSQANQLPFIHAVNRLISETDLEKGAFSSVRRRAASIARNELHRARAISMFGHAIDEGFTFFVWIAALINTCPICAPRHGKVKSWRTWMRLGLPILHPGCRCSLVPSPVTGIPIPQEPIQRFRVKSLGAVGRLLGRFNPEG